MKAIVWTAYGSPDVLQMQDVEKPTPSDNEVLVRIRATTVTTPDCELRTFKTFSALWLPLRLYVGLLRPTRVKILGQEIAGEIEAVGKDVTLFKEGDQVFALTGLRLSANAEFICLPEKAMMALKPANMTFEEAAAVPLGGPEAFHLLRPANIQSGSRVLIIGAGGTIGSYGVQVARHFGAEVTGVDSTEKLDMLRSIGAEQVVDYTREDFARNGQTYDVIFDAPGKSSFSRCEGSLKENGQYISANPGWSQLMRMGRGHITPGRKVQAAYSSPTKKDLLLVRELIEAGKIKAVIDRRYPLEKTAEAHRYAETGRKRGNIAITVA